MIFIDFKIYVTHKMKYHIYMDVQFIKKHENFVFLFSSKMYKMSHSAIQSNVYALRHDRRTSTTH